MTSFVGVAVGVTREPMRETYINYWTHWCYQERTDIWFTYQTQNLNPPQTNKQFIKSQILEWEPLGSY